MLISLEYLEKYSQSLCEDYINGLIEFSGGAISIEEAKKICQCNFRPTDYFPGSQIIHKGPLFNAKEYVRDAGLLSKKYLPVPSPNSQTRVIQSY